MSSFVKTFSAELIAKEIYVNAGSPGYTTTNGFDKTGMAKEQIASLIESITPTLPFKRFADAAEIAKVVTFLASDEASYLHGSEVVVDGGYTIIK